MVVYHPKVPGEVCEIYQYYSDISEELGEDFWNRLMSANDYAAEFEFAFEVFVGLSCIKPKSLSAHAHAHRSAGTAGPGSDRSIWYGRCLPSVK